MGKNDIDDPRPAVGNGEPRLRRQRKRPKRCAIGFYHTSAVVLFIGIIVALAGVSSSRLFEIFVYDNRHPPLFHHISIHVGLFDVKGEISGNGANPVVEPLEHPPSLDGMLPLLASIFLKDGLTKFINIYIICK